MPALLIDPRSVVSREELTLGDEQRHQRRSPGLFPAIQGNLGLCPVHALLGGFHVDPRLLPQSQTQARPTFDDPRPENLANLGDQGIESGLGGRGEPAWPEGLDQLVAFGQPMTVQD
jgi:hypothetical protein